MILERFTHLLRNRPNKRKVWRIRIVNPLEGLTDEQRNKHGYFKTESGEWCFYAQIDSIYTSDAIGIIWFSPKGDFISGSYVSIDWFVKSKIDATEIPFKPWEFNEKFCTTNYGWYVMMELEKECTNLKT